MTVDTAAQKKVGALPVKGFEEEKQSNEIKFFIPTLQQTEICGRTISADAMHTQRESADYVVSQGAHFHFTVKGNQKNLFEAIETWFEMEAKHQKPACQEPWHKDHGRITSRKVWMTDKLNDYVEFPHVNLVFAMQRTVKDPNGKKKDSIEIAFGVASLSKDETSAQEVLQVNRGHWAVESAHWVLETRPFGLIMLLLDFSWCPKDLLYLMQIRKSAAIDHALNLRHA